MELTGKAALITGGTMGLGAAIAKEFARRGADIAIAARNVGDPADEVKGAITVMGRRCALIQADLSQADDCARRHSTDGEGAWPP